MLLVLGEYRDERTQAHPPLVRGDPVLEIGLLCQFLQRNCLEFRSLEPNHAGRFGILGTDFIPRVQILLSVFLQEIDGVGSVLDSRRPTER